jgi:hypothetical protein
MYNMLTVCMCDTHLCVSLDYYTHVAFMNSLNSSSPSYHHFCCNSHQILLGAGNLPVLLQCFKSRIGHCLSDYCAVHA